MDIGPQTTTTGSRTIWLRRGSPSNPGMSGVWHSLMLSTIGNAAARETLVTATPHLASIWTDLFHQLLVPNSGSLRWRDRGPGIGRDARIAYSSLLGRYMARAYLSKSEGVRFLVPLDVAKREFRHTPYCIRKDPPSRGLEADWIGLDDSGLVIVEAKGSFDCGRKTWRGPQSTPQTFRTALQQTDRTTVFHHSRRLPARRWAVASRWGTEDNGCEPTLLARASEEERLDEEHYRNLGDLLHQADVSGVLRGMGYPGPDADLDDAMDEVDLAAPVLPAYLGEWVERLRPVKVSVDDVELDPGCAAIVGPFGVLPLRDPEDGRRLLRVREEFNLDWAIASLSFAYLLETSGAGHSQEREPGTASERLASWNGLTVAWPSLEEEVAFG